MSNRIYSGELAQKSAERKVDVLLTHIPDPDNAGVGTFFGITARIVPFGDFLLGFPRIFEN